MTQTKTNIISPPDIICEVQGGGDSVADVVFLSHARHKGGAEIATPDNAAPD